LGEVHDSSRAGRRAAPRERFTALPLPFGYLERPDTMDMNSPATAAADPKTIIQTERSVGDPVNASETSEANESELFNRFKVHAMPGT
jgi:hypothetical protein